MMSIEENKALARRWCEEFNTQNWAGIVAITAPDFVQHGAPPASLLTSDAGAR
jgi:hypothetical protein